MFKITDVAPAVFIEESRIEPIIAEAKNMLASSEEPDIDLSMSCNKPYPCSFWKYCSRHIPNPSVFNLYRMPFKKKLEYYEEGLLTYEDLQRSNKISNDKQLRQIQYFLADKGTYVEIENIQSFLETLSYPIYFLDFETMQPVIPIYVGTKPYAHWNIRTQLLCQCTTWVRSRLRQELFVFQFSALFLNVV